jgi:CTP:molybdopterin cytidylyltransferase MocA
MNGNRVIILAAGRGLRAGGPKALHRLRDEAWWKVQAGRIATIGLPTTWVISRRVQDGMVHDGGPPPGAVLADEMAPMFASVLAGARAVQSQSDESRHGGSPPIRGIFILPVDVPAPDKDVFDALSTAMANRADIAAAIPTCSGKHGHPVYLAWSFVHARLLGETHGPGARLDNLIGQSRIEVDVADPSVLENLNTADDFDRWSSH